MQTEPVALQTIKRGVGESVILLPFLGRSVADLEPLAFALVRAGYRTVCVNPRGIGSSRGPLENLSLVDYATDIIGVIEEDGNAPVHLVGYTFSNRVARCVAALRPDLVCSAVLLAAGGAAEAPRSARAQRTRRMLFHELTRIGAGSAEDRNGFWKRLQKKHVLRRVLQRRYFSTASSVPASWLYDWWPQSAMSQFDAMARAPSDDWWRAGGVPLLVLQGSDDRIAPPENGYWLREALGQQAEVIDVPQAGHALLTEQPAFIADKTMAFLQRQRISAVR